ncbi:MAG: hypothetical protein IT393_03605 [Nitrospirae bacterium]|nr:hypothetical protein [Nitrospirota bacterium]
MKGRILFVLIFVGYFIIWTTDSAFAVSIGRYKIEKVDFGPYRGKIVDAEMKEPIEGVVVVAEWGRKTAGILAAGTKFMDAQETVTDKNGEFYIPGIWVFNPWRHIVADVTLYIYKSGYTYKEMGPFNKWNEVTPEKIREKFDSEVIEKVDPKTRGEVFDKYGGVIDIVNGKPVIILRRMTMEERQQHPPPSPSALIPFEEIKKLKLYIEEVNKEEKALGKEGH